MTHVRTSPHFSQSNGEVARWHGTLEIEWTRPKIPLSLDEARRAVANIPRLHNEALHRGSGSVTPRGRLEGRQREIFGARDRRLHQARERRRERRQAAHASGLASHPGTRCNPSAGRNGGRLYWRATCQGIRRPGSSCRRVGVGGGPLPHAFPMPVGRQPVMPQETHARSNHSLSRDARSPIHAEPVHIL